MNSSITAGTKTTLAESYDQHVQDELRQVTPEKLQELIHECEERLDKEDQGFWTEVYEYHLDAYRDEVTRRERAEKEAMTPQQRTEAPY